MLIKTFNAKNLDRKFLRDRIQKESKRIFETQKGERYRTLEQIYHDNGKGQAAEAHLILNCGFLDDPRPFKDVISFTGIPIEVKVTENPHNVRRILNKCGEDKLKPWWKDYPDWVFIWIMNPKSLEYKFYGSFYWAAELIEFLPKEWNDEKEEDLKKDQLFLDSIH
jgi:hypothetical protein